MESPTDPKNVRREMLSGCRRSRRSVHRGVASPASGPQTVLRCFFTYLHASPAASCLLCA